jgi:6-pyruvoyl-tetrahydropterin synthase
VQTLLSFQRRFDASHLVGSEWPECGDLLHGHEWVANIEVLYDPLADVVEWPGPVFNALVDELADRHLNDMIAPAQATPYGVVHWLYEKLAPRMRVERIECWYNQAGAVLLADQVRRR